MYMYRDRDAHCVYSLRFCLPNWEKTTYFTRSSKFEHGEFDNPIIKTRMCEVHYGGLHYSGCGHTELHVVLDIKQCAAATARQ
jgi:hypothetical protein